MKSNRKLDDIFNTCVEDYAKPDAVGFHRLTISSAMRIYSDAFGFSKKASRFKQSRGFFALLSVLGCFLCCEAFAAINRLTLGGFEGHLALLAALYANCCEHLSSSLLRILLCGTAILTSGGLILKASLRVEFLLASCENEFVTTVSALQCLVLVHFLFLLNGL